MSWRVRLAGDEAELQCLAEDLVAPDLAIVRDKEMRDFVLVSAQLATIDDEGTAEKLATELVGRLRGVARLLISDLDVEITLAVAGFECVGHRSERVSVRERSSGTASRSEQWMQLAGTDATVAHVLRLVGELWWDDMAEITSLILEAKGGEARVVELGWASQHELARLKQSTADGSRSRMMPRAAESLVLRLVRRWLESIV